MRVPTVTASLSLATALTACAVTAAGLSGQDIGDAARLTGVERVDLAVSAQWDEMITTSAGGATAGQFEEALLMGLRAALAEADAGPGVVDGAPDVVQCHVDTFYDSGLIVWSVRTALARPGADGRSVIVWLESWVGSYTAQQLHVIWTLADQCAAAFLTEWAEANPG